MFEERAPEHVPDDYTAPCGCRFWCDVIDGVRTVIFEPCAAECQIRDHALSYATELNRPVTTLDLT